MTEIAIRTGGALALDPGQTDWTERQRAALEQLGVADAPAGDLAVFLHQAQRTGLDPFSRQIYLIKRWDGREKKNKWTIQTGIDGFRQRAEEHPQYAGQTPPQWCGDDGVWREVWPHRGNPPHAARVGVVRKDWPQPVYAVAHFWEYAQTTKDGDLTRMWSDKAAVMIAKCAEALALRKAFPRALSGLYIPEETQRDTVQADAVREDQAPAAALDWDAEITARAGNRDQLLDLHAEAKRQGISQEVLDRIVAAGKAAADQVAEAEVLDAEIVDQPADAEPAATDKQLTAIATALGEYGVKERGHRLAVVSLLVGDRVESSKQLTKSEAGHVLDAIAKHTAEGRIAETIQAAIAAWGTLSEEIA